MELSKKGFLFTLLSFVIALYFTLMFIPVYEKPIDASTATLPVMVESINYQNDRFFTLVAAAGALSGRRALQCMLNDTNYYGYFRGLTEYNEFDYVFKAYFRKGYFLTPTKPCAYMKNNTLDYYIGIFVNVSENSSRFKSAYTINNISVYQKSDPFVMDVEMNVTYNLSIGFINVSQTQVVMAYVNLTGLLDPLYIRGGKYNQTIARTPVSKIEGTWNYTDFETMYNNHLYRASYLGVSFINRLKGNFTPSEMGIESFVNHTWFGIAPMLNNQSVVDHYYWGGVNFTCNLEGNRLPTVVNVSGLIMPSIPRTPPLQIDERHRASFNISSKFTNYTC